MHSPSKRFEKLSLDFPAGAAKGIEKGTPDAVAASTDMVKAMLDKSKEALQKQQAALRERLASINGSAGIAALNNLTEQPVSWQPSVTVNNSGAAEMIAGLIAEMKGVRDDIKRMKVVLDTDEVVGEIAEKVGSELTMETRRW